MKKLIERGAILVKIVLPGVSEGIQREHAFGEERIIEAMCSIELEDGDDILYINDGEQIQIHSGSNPKLMLVIKGLSAGNRLQLARRVNE